MIIASLNLPLAIHYIACSLPQSTPLHLAAGYNRVRIVDLLLKYGADVHAKDKGYANIIVLFRPSGL